MTTSSVPRVGLTLEIAFQISHPVASKLFIRHLSAVRHTITTGFETLSQDWGGDERTYERLKRVRVWSPDEKQLERQNL